MLPSYRWVPVALLFAAATVWGGPDAGPRPAATEGRLLKEVWETAYLDGVAAGYLHKQFREIKFGDRTVIESSVETELALKRFGQPVQLKSIQATHENPLGRLRAFVLQEGMSSQQRLYRKGQVNGQELVWTTQLGSKAANERRLPWSDQALGLYAQEELLSQRPAEAAKEFTYDRFEPVFDTLLTVAVRVGPAEPTSFPGKPTRMLRKVTCRLDPKLTQDAPPEFLWIDEKGEVQKRQLRLPLLGELTTYPTTKEQATAQRGGAGFDVGRAQLWPVAKALPRPALTKSVTYRATLLEGLEAVGAFPQDQGQTVRVLAPSVVEIQVEGQRRPGATSPYAAPTSQRLPTECLQSNSFITSDDANVCRVARQAVGVEPDTWRKATRIERWVRENMRGYGTTEGFATAADVARTLTGDCKGHATLAAAMCRAVGVPARIAVGLVYVPREKAFGFHMWIEVWVDGQWYGLDPTLGQGQIGADHIKVFSHDLNGETSFAPMLPIAKLAGRVKLEIVEAR